MRKKLNSFFIPGRRFKKEFKRQARLFINITLGFTIAFTWRQTIFDISESLIQKILNLQSASTLSILASTLITLISIGIVYLSSYYLKDSHENY